MNKLIRWSITWYNKHLLHAPMFRIMMIGVFLLAVIANGIFWQL